MSAIGDALRRARTANGVAQDALAPQVGVTQGAVSGWEQGRSEPSLDQIGALEKALGLRRGQLLIEAGYVDANVSSVEAAIDLTDELQPAFKQALKATYRSLAGR